MTDVIIVVTGSSRVGGNASTPLPPLSTFKRTDKTPWKQLREAAIKLYDSEFRSAVFSVSLVDMPKQDKVIEFKQQPTIRLILNLIIKSVGHLQQIEYFESYLGDMGSSVALQPQGCGFVDLRKKVRYEFKNGAITVTHMD